MWCSTVDPASWLYCEGCYHGKGVNKVDGCDAKGTCKHTMLITNLSVQALQFLELHVQAWGLEQ